MDEKRMREAYEMSAFKCTFEEYKAIQCCNCDKEDYPHREAYRRVPHIDGGLGLCPNLNK